MNRYHTSIKICYALGLQNELLDAELRKTIPASTGHYWKKQVRTETIIGLEQSKSIERHFSDIRATYHPANAIPRKVFNAYCRFMVMIIECFDQKTLHRFLRNNMQKVINTIDELAEHVSYDKASALISISTKTLYHWRTKVKHICEASPLFLCVKRHPNQATIPEVNTIRRYLSDPDYAHWGIHSIWALAFRNGETQLSRQSWYHYNSLLKLRLSSGKAIKPKYIPLRASKPNEIWHADITVFKVQGIKQYIYTVMDNYSRFVHAWSLQKEVSAAHRVATIREAIISAFGSQSANSHSIRLITDGGPENDNQTVKSFIASCQVNIDHQIALRDITQSNSMMEAFYATAKYRYLYRLKIDNFEELSHRINEMMHEYNHIKPHYALGTCTPAEVLAGSDPLAANTAVFRQAAAQRRETNRKAACKAC